MLKQHWTLSSTISSRLCWSKLHLKRILRRAKFYQTCCSKFTKINQQNRSFWKRVKSDTYQEASSLEAKINDEYLGINWVQKLGGDNIQAISVTDAFERFEGLVQSKKNISEQIDEIIKNKSFKHKGKTFTVDNFEPVTIDDASKCFEMNRIYKESPMSEETKNDEFTANLRFLGQLNQISTSDSEIIRKGLSFDQIWKITGAPKHGESEFYKLEFVNQNQKTFTIILTIYFESGAMNIDSTIALQQDNTRKKKHPKELLPFIQKVDKSKIFRFSKPSLLFPSETKRVEEELRGLPSPASLFSILAHLQESLSTISI